MSAPASTALRRVGTNSVVGFSWTLVSRITGLGRVVVVAAVLGPTAFGDLYQQANDVPNLTFELLTGSLFVSLVVPALVRHLDEGSRPAAARLASGFLTVSVLAAAVAAALVIAAGPLVLGLLSAGVPEAADRPGTGTAWLLLSLLALQTPLYAVAGIGGAAQNARGRFALAAAASSVENLGIMAVLGVHATVFGIGTADGQGPGGVVLLGAGTTAAVLLHAALQWYGARRVGLTLRPARGWRDPEVRGLVRLALPSLGHAALNVSRYFCILVVAAAVPGGVVAFTVAWAFYNLPVALAAKPVAQAALPELSRAHLRDDLADYGHTFDRSVGLVLFVTVPAGAAYALLGRPLAVVVGLGEMATPEAHALVHLALLGTSAGVVGAALMTLGTQASYARRAVRRPLLAVALRAALSVAGMLGALALLEGPVLLLAVGATVAASDLLAGGWLCRGVHRGRPPAAAGVGRAVARTVAATAAAAAAVLPVLALLGNPADRVAGVVTLLVAGTVGGAAYLAVQRWLRSPELSGLLSLLPARRAR